MNGTVNTALEATLRLQIHGLNTQVEVTAVIDTGYNGFLSLPVTTITALSLPPLASRSVTLGDASRRVFDFYEATVIWDGHQKIVSVLCVEGDPLIGTALLKGYKMEADFVIGGTVRIVPIP